MKQIENKLSENKAMISKAHKGNSIVILYQDEYNQKYKNLFPTIILQQQTQTSPKTCKNKLGTQ